MHENHGFSGALLHILRAKSVDLDFLGNLGTGHGGWNDKAQQQNGKRC
jgi:hypothetical protein